jgi:hypothetical protein
VQEVVVYPNPCNRNTAVRGSVKFEVPSEADIYIYNIETFKVFEALGVGRHAEGNGRDLKGELVAPGVYFYIVDMGADEVKGKIFITK